jgi:hypothetical protein
MAGIVFLIIARRDVRRGDLQDVDALLRERVQDRRCRQPAERREVGFFIPGPIAGRPSPSSTDVDVDFHGLIYAAERNVGFDILELRR